MSACTGVASSASAGAALSASTGAALSASAGSILPASAGAASSAFSGITDAFSTTGAAAKAADANSPETRIAITFYIRISFCFSVKQ